MKKNGNLKLISTDSVPFGWRAGNVGAVCPGRLALAGEEPWDWNIVTGAMLLSPQWCRATGFHPREVEHHIDFWDELRHPEDVERLERVLRVHYKRRTGIYECPVRLRTRSGAYRWILDRGRVVEWDDNGEPLRMIGVNIDISDRKCA